MAGKKQDWLEGVKKRDQKWLTDNSWVSDDLEARIQHGPLVHVDRHRLLERLDRAERHLEALLGVLDNDLPGVYLSDVIWSAKMFLKDNS